MTILMVTICEKITLLKMKNTVWLFSELRRLCVALGIYYLLINCNVNQCFRGTS